ncbi:hypothetical protein OKW38_002297 [Paraburkholderia sp. MM5496-R1]|uniref:hypothetical protein n=1 Tax=unclassified Paraburkholderia TaxID=2615204 RepID=UPI000A520CCE|nr:MULTISPECIES: hypothetical protein [unclassified Paraburkholderia]MBB5413712.1 hypothetical protein [Paraburkholderia sp. HC6.4b]MBB5456057.1 hypothetical protein [Paraburkholderia sp. Kb1A]MBC8724382.1 hypothetical protein [Paraburkholderia sp. 31.1]
MDAELFGVSVLSEAQEPIFVRRNTQASDHVRANQTISSRQRANAHNSNPTTQARFDERALCLAKQMALHERNKSSEG